MKKTALVLLVALLFLAVAVTQLVNSGRANPLLDGGLVPPDSSAKPPRISIFAPQNNTVYTTSAIPFSLKVSLPESMKAVETKVHAVYYKADWLEKPVYIYSSGTAGFENQISSTRSSPKNRYFQYSQPITSIPDGNHTIVVCAIGKGSYVEGIYGYGFYINASYSVYFTIDTTPEVVLLLENKTYETTSVLLNFTVNDPNSKIAYSLDKRENVSIAGNTTLSNLLYGEHNITVYAQDIDGNVGVSETINFNIAKPLEPEPATFPATLVVTTFSFSGVIVVIGLLVYFKKRKH